MDALMRGKIKCVRRSAKAPPTRSWAFRCSTARVRAPRAAILWDNREVPRAPQALPLGTVCDSQRQRVQAHAGICSGTAAAQR
jgi:hypothetical protein